MSHPQRSGECQNSTPAILSSARSLFSSCAMIPSLLFWPPSLSTRAPRSVASSRNGGCQPESDPTQAGIEGDRGRSRARRKHATPLLRASSGSGKQAALLKREANEPSASLSQSNNNTMLYSAGHLERHTGNPQRGGQALGPLRSPSRGRLRILGVPAQREGGITLAGWATGAAWATCAARERWDPPRFPPSSALRRKCSSRDP